MNGKLQQTKFKPTWPLAAQRALKKEDDCNLPDGPRVDVEKSTLAAKASRQSSTKTALFVSFATLSELMTTKIQTYTKRVNIKILS